MVMPRTIPSLEVKGLGNNGSSAVGTANTQVRPANSLRKVLWIVNESDTDIYLALGRNALVSTGILLKSAGGAIEFNLLTHWPGVINAIHAGTGDKTLTWQEIS